MPIRDDELVHLSKEELNKGKKDMKLPEFFLGHTKEQADQVLKDYERYVTKIAGRAAMLTGLDKNDLIQEGFIGLARAVRDFEDGRGASFLTIAIYKIKDAIKEFITTQGKNVVVPRYVKEVAKFATTLRDLTSRAVGKEISPYTPIMDVWAMAKEVRVKGIIMQEIVNALNGLANLANRSNTTVPGLLERAELMPVKMIEIEEGHTVFGNMVVENDLLEKIHLADIVGYIEKLIPEEDFSLLYDRHIDGLTIEEVGEKLGITAASVSIREHKLLKKLRRHEDKIFAHETVEGFKGARQRRRRSVPGGAICSRFGETKEIAATN